MAGSSLFAVERRQRGPKWDRSRPMEEQALWPEHAAYMNDLVDRGFIVLGGPVGDNGRVLLIVRATDEDEIHATLAEDPWSYDFLLTESVEPWRIRLGEVSLLQLDSPQVVAKSLDSPEAVRRFLDDSERCVVELGRVTVGLGTYRPGWRWSRHVQPLSGTESAEHSGYVVSGRLRVRAKDGTEVEVGPGEAFVAAPGSDAWVVGAEPCVALDFAFS